MYLIVLFIFAKKIWICLASLWVVCVCVCVYDVYEVCHFIFSSVAAAGTWEFGDQQLLSTRLDRNSIHKIKETEIAPSKLKRQK